VAQRFQRCDKAIALTAPSAAEVPSLLANQFFRSAHEITN
jgi:hypothetical protein